MPSLVAAATYPSYESSLTVIRAELARAVSSHGIPTSIEESIDDAVGETSELLAGISGSLHVLEDSLDGSQLYAKFDTVSLSESPINEKRKRAHDEEHHDTLNEVEIANDDCGLTPTEDDSVAHRGPPKSRPASIEANLDSPRLSPPSGPNSMHQS
jgi:hypothetical protein